ncbi:Protein of unknown function [Pyronema omphalodes CBS 100304]|uniref:Uncharacterized protein n=1 Tax=Pyronema omphalodes (strain CBS 100304) TaxID=1076935 RepID=U4KZ71_PYROM|nr:Protein of unknown function [Pyronema omphalodes CBS 100304]
MFCTISTTPKPLEFFNPT